MAASTEDDLRLARRLKLGVRLVVYPMLLVLLAVAWHVRTSRGADSPGAPFRGSSSQGEEVTATIDGGRLTSLGVPLQLRCDDGQADRFTWTPSPDTYQQHGDTVTAHRLPTTHVDGERSYTYEARLQMVLGDHPHGTVWLTNTWTWTATGIDGPRMVCQSGPVTISLQHIGA
jgi:hypothetical protein